MPSRQHNGRPQGTPLRRNGRGSIVGAVREPPTFSRSHSPKWERIGKINYQALPFHKKGLILAPHRLAFGLPTPHKEGE